MIYFYGDDVWKCFVEIIMCDTKIMDGSERGKNFGDNSPMHYAYMFVGYM